MPHAIKVDLLDHILNPRETSREIDDAPRPRVYQAAEKEESPPMDRIFVQLTYTKTRVKVKLNTSLIDLHEKYFARARAPPLRVLTAAYKSVGCSEKFLEQFKRTRERAKRVCSSEFINKFVAEPKKRAKKAKKAVVKTRDDDETRDEDKCDTDEEPTISDHEDDGYDIRQEDADDNESNDESNDEFEQDDNEDM